MTVSFSFEFGTALKKKVKSLSKKSELYITENRIFLLNLRQVDFPHFNASEHLLNEKILNF